VGGVSERPARETRGAILSHARARNGGRHPDPRNVGSLRGRPSERRSWPVRLVCTGLVPMQAAAPATTGALWTPRRGTSSACAKRTHSSWKALKRRSPRSRTRPSLGPEARARQSPFLRMGLAVGSVSRSGKPAQAGGTGTEVGTNGRMRGSPRVTASPREKVVRDASEKEGGHGLRPCEETRAPVGVRTSCSLQKSAGRVWSRISSHAALQKEWRWE